MLFTDSDLGIEGSIIIDTLIIKEGEDMIPKYTMTLREERLLDRLKNPKSDRLYCRWWAGNRRLEYPTDTVYHPFTGQSAFLSRTHNDTAAGLIGFLAGAIFGASGLQRV